MSDIIRPIEPFELTQGFGENPALYARFGLAGHNGWDFRTKYPDTPQGYRNILASWFSKHYKTADEGNDGFGRYFEVIVSLKNTYKLTYAHCQSIQSFAVREEAEAMAISDNTGNSTGSHLHLTIKRGHLINGAFQSDNYSNGYFGAIEPQEFFDELRAFKNTLPVISSQPNMNDPRAGWFDLLSRTEFGTTGWEKLTDEQVKKWIRELPERRVAGGKWDALCDRLGLAHTVSVDEALSKAPNRASIVSELKNKIIVEVKKLT